jgi:hypothetical protein
LRTFGVKHSYPMSFSKYPPFKGETVLLFVCVDETTKLHETSIHCSYHSASFHRIQ